MSPKKPYQRRLPTVLPPVQLPTPRVAPELESLPPEADLLPEPAPPLAPPVAAPREPKPKPMPKPGPEPAGPRERRDKVVLIAVAWLVGIGVLAYALLAGLRDDPADPGAGGPADPPRALAPAEAYVDTRVLPAGDLVVRQWIRAREPLTALGLELPDLPGADDVSADQVEVVADGVVAAGPDRVTAAGATYTFEESTTVLVAYRLEGVVQVSDSVAGRALALATALDTAYAPKVERETRVVHGPEVLSLACSSQSDESPEPCGRDSGDGQWQVDLSGDRVDDRVLAQLNLG
ncbi:hypothetical protein EXE59_21035 [Nocardioides eburneiflavus]|uniref:Uncharacterized protein n=1 Tax=Nocardioides eburneiflavus TaxID=2518372 RepID=A0A4Z1CIC7_9ACTN|nr:hypothetical protein [Nocardioides eburneiflavus]TGN66158.1 hypothetical protein EXE59_21035 [Nocardioides eburneiflavus]